MSSTLFIGPVLCKDRVRTIVALPGIRKLMLGRDSATSAASIDTTKSHSLHEEGRESPQHIKPFRAIPGPGSHPILHIMKNFLPVLGKYGANLRYKYFEDLYHKYGSIVRDNFIMDMKIVHLFDPKDIEIAFRSSGKTPIRPPMEVLKSIRESRPDIYKHLGLLALNGEDWYKVRQMFQSPMLQMKSVEVYCQSMDRVAEDFVDHLHTLRDDNGEVAKTLKEMYKWALESIGLVVFNTRLGCLEKGLTSTSETMKLVTAVQDTFTLMNKMESGFHIWRWISTPSYYKVAKAQMIIASMASKYINNTLERIKDLPDNSEERVMLLVKLLSAKDTTFEDVIVMVIDILLAGVDTTSHTSGMTLYHLAKNPQVQDRLVEEVCRVMPPTSTPTTPAMLQELRYLRACIKETMRMSPITDGNARILDKDVALSGYNVPAGTIIVMQHRTNGKFGFKEANEYKPERWLKAEMEDVPSVHPFTVLPFGYGTRMCIGRRFAEQEMLLLLSRLIQRYRVEYHYGDIEMASRFVNVPDKPLKISFIERSS